LFPECSNPPTSSYSKTIYSSIAVLACLFGKNLSLKGFNLSCWSGVTFPTVEVCFLDFCYPFSILPEMPLLHKLTIVNCEVNVIPSLPSLATLLTNNCGKLEVIGELANLAKAKISFCNKLSDVSGLNKEHTLTLISCRLFETIPSLKNLIKLEIKHCEVTGNHSTMVQFHEGVANCSHFKSSFIDRFLILSKYLFIEVMRIIRNAKLLWNRIYS
jgi:hypothetical protein